MAISARVVIAPEVLLECGITLLDALADYAHLEEDDLRLCPQHAARLRGMKSHERAGS
jgi:uncharacterized protein (DUF433 family)